MRALTITNGDLWSYSDKIDESCAEINNTFLKHLLVSNYNVAGDKGKIKGHLPLEHLFGFCRTFKRITKQIRFHLTFKTPDLQEFIFTTIGGDVKVSFDKL